MDLRSERARTLVCELLSGEEVHEEQLAKLSVLASDRGAPQIDLARQRPQTKPCDSPALLLFIILACFHLFKLTHMDEPATFKLPTSCSEDLGLLVGRLRQAAQEADNLQNRRQYP